MIKCTYCSKGYHPDNTYMKKKIDMLTQLLEKNNISLLDFSNKREGGSNSKTMREYMPWLLAPQAHLASSLILELPDIWFQKRGILLS